MGGRLSPVSSSVLRLESTRGQPLLIIARDDAAGLEAVVHDRQLHGSPTGSISNVTFERRSAAIRSRTSSVSSSDVGQLGRERCAR